MQNKNEFLWPIRVYYEDTDCGGVVYHANYIRFLEQARTEWLRSLNIIQSQLAHNFNIVFAITKINIDFISPAKLDDQLEISVTVHQLKKASIEFFQQINNNGVCCCRATVKVACIDTIRFRPTAIPPKIYECFKSCKIN